MTNDFFYPKNNDENKPKKYVGFAPDVPFTSKLPEYKPYYDTNIVRSLFPETDKDPILTDAERKEIMDTVAKEAEATQTKLLSTALPTTSYTTNISGAALQAMMASVIPDEVVCINPKHGKEYRFFEDMITAHGIKPVTHSGEVSFVVKVGPHKYALVDFLDCFENPMNELTMKAIFKILKDVDTLTKKLEKLEQNQNIPNGSSSKESSHLEAEKEQ